MGLFSELRKRLGHRLHSEADAELRYLNDATSPVDLEMRMREVDRGRFKSRLY